MRNTCTVIMTVLSGRGWLTYLVECERLPSYSRSEYVGMSCSNYSNVEERVCRYYFNNYIFSSKRLYGHGRTTRTVSYSPEVCFHVNVAIPKRFPPPPNKKSCM